MQTVGEVTAHLGSLGLGGDIDAMMRHSADFLSMSSIAIIGWLWLWQAALAREALEAGASSVDFYEGKLCAAQYWINTEVPRVIELAALCRSGDDSYARMREEWF
jgi:hypothetical protein